MHFAWTPPPRFHSIQSIPAVVIVLKARKPTNDNDKQHSYIYSFGTRCCGKGRIAAAAVAAAFNQPALLLKWWCAAKSVPVSSSPVPVPCPWPCRRRLSEEIKIYSLNPWSKARATPPTTRMTTESEEWHWRLCYMLYSTRILLVPRIVIRCGAGD